MTKHILTPQNGQKPHKGSLTLRQGQGTTLREKDREKRESRERKCSELSTEIGS